MTSLLCKLFIKNREDIKKPEVRRAYGTLASGVGIAFVPDACICAHAGVRFVPIHNWHQALYMCILYDKWLEPPVWDFVEALVKAFRAAPGSKKF